MAYLAWRDPLRWYTTYTKARWITFFVEAFLMLLGIIIYVFVQTIHKRTWARHEYTISLIWCALTVAVFVVDYHFCRVVHYRVRKELRNAEKEAALKAAEEEEARRRAAMRPPTPEEEDVEERD
jgi:uncharacterized membrane protein YcjF (UPF0283 family)